MLLIKQRLGLSFYLIITQSHCFAGFSTLPFFAGCCGVLKPNLSSTLDNIYNLIINILLLHNFVNKILLCCVKIKMAQSRGFEPPKVISLSCFRNKRIQPLCQDCVCVYFSIFNIEIQVRCEFLETPPKNILKNILILRLFAGN